MAITSKDKLEKLRGIVEILETDRPSSEEVARVIADIVKSIQQIKKTLTNSIDSVQSNSSNNSSKIDNLSKELKEVEKKIRKALVDKDS